MRHAVLLAILASLPIYASLAFFKPGTGSAGKGITGYKCGKQNFPLAVTVNALDLGCRELKKLTPNSVVTFPKKFKPKKNRFDLDAKFYYQFPLSPIKKPNIFIVMTPDCRIAGMLHVKRIRGAKMKKRNAGLPLDAGGFGSRPVGSKRVNKNKLIPENIEPEIKINSEFDSNLVNCQSQKSTAPGKPLNPTTPPTSRRTRPL